jgi:hypothetical protein
MSEKLFFIDFISHYHIKQGQIIIIFILDV